MSYLLDTNVVSETRRRSPDPNVVRWLESQGGDDFYLSVLTIGELVKGIEMRRAKDPGAADALHRWMIGLRDLFADRILAVDADIATVWGELAAKGNPPVIDGLLAATALAHGLTLATRNTKDVAATGVPHVNPWEPAPGPVGIP